MPVLSVSTTRPNFALLRNVALKQGVQCDLVDVTDTRVYADLIGDAERMIRVSLRAGATMHAVIGQIEHGEKVRAYPARPEA